MDNDRANELIAGARAGKLMPLSAEEAAAMLRNRPMTVFCELPDRITSLTVQDGKIYAETASGLYEILKDGSYVGVSF